MNKIYTSNEERIAFYKEYRKKYHIEHYKKVEKIKKPNLFTVNKNNKTITIRDKVYKYNAFSILENCIKIYKWNVIIINF